MTTTTKGRTAPELVAAPEPAPEAEKKPSSAADFKRVAKDGVVYVLPGCGLAAKLRRPGLIGLVGAGATGNPALSPELLRMMTLTERPPTEEERIADFERNAKAYREVAARAFVEPKMVLDAAPNYERGEIGPDDITDQDYVWIYWTLAQGGAAQVEPFRVR